MEFKLLFCVAFIFLCENVTFAHKYKSGECPNVEPAASFDMKKVFVPTSNISI